jgi:DNA repair exonuclease SbcCD ATPase subunit
LFSYGKKWTEIDLDSNLAINIIGKNGDGKSVLVEAFYFALTGKPLRKCKKSTIVNIFNKKDCLVELKVEAGSHRFLIIRGVKPNVFLIFKDGANEPLDESAMMIDTQTYLETVLGYTPKNLKHTLIMSTTDYQPFLRLPAADKRLFVEDILSIEIFSIMNKLVKAKLSILKDEIRDNVTDIEKLQYKLNMILEYNKQQQENDDDELAEHRQNIIDEKLSLSKEVESIELRLKASIKTEQKSLTETLSKVEENSAYTVKAEKAALKTDIEHLKLKAKVLKETLAECKANSLILAGRVDDQKTAAEKLTEEKSVHATAHTIHSGKYDGDIAKYETGKKNGSDAQLKLKIKLESKQEDLNYYYETDECTECKQPIDPKFKTDQLAGLEDEIKALQLKSAKIKSELNKVEKFKHRIEKFKVDKITPLNEKVRELEDRLVDLKVSWGDDETEIKVTEQKEIACRKQMATFKESSNKLKVDAAARITGYENTDVIIDDMKAKSKYRTDRIHTETADRITNCNADTKRRITGYKNKIETLESKERGNIKDELAPGRDVEEAEAKKKALTFKKLVYDVTIRILSDKGIKTYIIKRYIPKLNNLVNVYLEILSAPYKLSFNEELEEKIALQGYDNLSYDNFSMGERQRCDIAMLFSFLDIGKMKNSVASNLLLMDEIFDRSLDDDGIVGIINIIESMKAKGYTIINISHKHQLADKFDETYRASKDKFSRLDKI